MTTPNPIDRAAFDLAIKIASKDPVQRRRFDEWLAKGESYDEVGRSAAFHCQIVALDLMPWQLPPCYADMSASVLSRPYGDPGARRESAELALRMRRCGVSRWHPDPARECDRVEAQQRQQPAK
jgi:hypothetical protein